MRFWQPLFVRTKQAVSNRYWLLLCVSVLLVLVVGNWQPAFAKEMIGEENTEQVTYEWFLLQWSNHQVVCTVVVSHEGIPTSQEIQTRCDRNVFTSWLSTSTCEGAISDGNTTGCDGLYLIFNDVLTWMPVNAEPLNSVSFDASLLGCVPEPPNNWCADKPSLIIRTEGGIAFSPVARIDYKIGSDLYSCPEAICEIPLALTDMRGTLIQFWGVDVAGTSGVVHEMRYRLLDTGNYQIVTGSEDEGYIIDIVGSALQGNDGNCCSNAWATFRPVEMPQWLTSPSEASFLKTNQRYYYLAGRLIKHGVSDPGVCPDGGLQPNGYATECGLSLALQDVMVWQNQYDELIILAADKAGVPASLLKNLFAQESQMWPADYSRYEFGLGHITEPGTDTLLLWNYDFFMKFCTLQFGFSDECQGSYSKLSLEDQRILMGLVLNFSTAYCGDCDYSVGQSDVPFAVEIFAETLKANAYQVGQIVRNVTGKEPGEVATYEDLWRFTLVNYTAGPGCLGVAVETTYVRYGRQLNWSNLQYGLTDGCDESIDYVNDITGDFPDTP